MRLLTGLSALMVATVGAQASLYSVTFNTNQMPSAQGWSYYSLNSSLTESQVFSTSGGALTSNTIGNGYQGQGGNFVYEEAMPSEFDANQDWIVEARVRVLSGELWSFHYGFCIGAAFDGLIASVGIMPGTWQDSSLNGWTRDNTQWTTWRIETDRLAGTYDLYADNVLLATRGLGLGTSGVGFPDHYTFLGDGTGGANAHAEVQSFSFRQVAIPTPGAAAIMSIGGLLATRRRR